MMAAGNNPNMGTRQYSNVGKMPVPGYGYDRAVKIDPEKLGSKFAEARGKRSQEEIERLTGVSQSAIARIEKGQFKKLAENVVTLAKFYRIAVPNIEFDDHQSSEHVAAELIPGRRSAGLSTTGVQELDIRAGMGGGGLPSGEVRRAGNHTDAVKPDRWFLPAPFIREELRAVERSLVVIETQGDSMLPTLSPGDRVFIDTSHTKPSPDGIYALRDQFGSLIVKRLHALAKRGRFSVISDNPMHPAKEVSLRDLDGEIVGRVVGVIKRF